MKAVYIKDARCDLCFDMYPDEAGNYCAYCLDKRTHNVDILEFFMGIFGIRALIKLEDGGLETVPVRKLKRVEE